MNIAQKLEALGLSGWTIRENHITDDPTILDRIEWSGERPSLTWSDLENAISQEEVLKQKEDQYSAWVDQGFDTGLGYKLRVADGDQVAFSKLMSSLMLKDPADSFEVKIEAMDGTIKTLTYLQFKALMIAYGDYCYASWKAGKGIQ